MDKEEWKQGPVTHIMCKCLKITPIQKYISGGALPLHLNISGHGRLPQSPIHSWLAAQLQLQRQTYIAFIQELLQNLHDFFKESRQTYVPSITLHLSQISQELTKNVNNGHVS